MTAFDSKWKNEKLVVQLIVRVRGHFALLFCSGRLWNIGLLNTLVQPLFCSLNLLSGGAYWRYGLLQTPSTLRRRNLKTHTALYLRLGLRSRVIRHENGAFRKRSSNRRNLKTLALSFRVEGNILKRTISNTIGSGEPRDFPGRDFLKQKYKTTGDFCVTKFPRCTQCRRPGLSFLGS